MYDGVPRALPGSVSAEPLAEAGRSVRSSPPGSALPVALASPQSTTSVSPCLLADDDVARLDVPVQDAPRVGVADRVADVEEPPQELAQPQRAAAGVGLQRLVGAEAVDRLPEAIALDEAHGVIRPAVGVVAQAVDRHDARVLQPAGDLGLQQEAGAAGRVVGLLVADLLEGDLAVQFLVEGHEDGAQAAPGVRPQDAEPLAVGGGRADGVGDRAVGVGIGRAAPEVLHGARQLGVAQGGEPLAGGAAQRDRGEAALDVAVPHEVPADERRDGRAVVGVEDRPRRGGRPAGGPCRGPSRGRR
jgi:hypothetical protein